jgi:alpha-tubulin suppressor-like RCC1 family protein
LNAGDKFYVDYSGGSWTVDYKNFPYVGPAGYTTDIDKTMVPGYKFDASVPYGYLLGKVDNGKEIRIGDNSGPFTADVSGFLSLRINDSDVTLGDNDGAITVNLRGPATNLTSLTTTVVSRGTVLAWGNNGNGELGDGNNSPAKVPVEVSISGVTVTAIASGYDHTLALTSAGTVYAFGNNNYGQMGDGNKDGGSETPVQVLNYSGGTGTYLSGITAIAAGVSFSLALTSSGNVYAWGNNGNGELGNASNAESNIPVEVQNSTDTGPLTGITAIAAGGYNVAAGAFALALTSSGMVYAWGYDGYGELGNRTTGNGAVSDDSNIPVLVSMPGGVTVTAISAGLWHNLALTSSGNVYAWGANTGGDLGNDTTTDSPIPLEVEGVGGSGYLSGITAISAGDSISLALMSGGNVYAWGYNQYGLLGYDSTTGSPTPVEVEGVGGSGYLSGITAISAHGLTGLALTSGGNVYAWGYNADGVLSQITGIANGYFSDFALTVPLTITTSSVTTTTTP